MNDDKSKLYMKLNGFKKYPVSPNHKYDPWECSRRSSWC